MFVVQFDTEHGSGQDGDDLTFYLDVFFHEFVKNRRSVPKERRDPR
jgi:hypothetical protein